MNTGSVSCTKCRQPLPSEFFSRQQTTPCPSCHSDISVEVFPALFQAPAAVNAGERVLVDGEAGCFYHPQKKAVLPCEECGRFLCALCDVELNGRHLCTACLESGKKKGKLKSLQDRRMLYDSMALTLAVVPILVWPFTIVTAPATFYVAIRYWKEPMSLIPRTKARFWLAMFIAALQIAGWTFGLIVAFKD